MAEVIIYTKPGCPYCSSALALLNKKGAEFTEIVASNDPPKKAEMVEKSGGKATFPQIFIDGKHIGGCDDIQALERKGGLDALLAA
ncbi:MAG TPA: glutaredoxin 3 [Brevundimonas sp.]|jgi:glutaredoxin 3